MSLKYKHIPKGQPVQVKPKQKKSLKKSEPPAATKQEVQHLNQKIEELLGNPSKVKNAADLISQLLNPNAKNS